MNIMFRPRAADFCFCLFFHSIGLPRPLGINRAMLDVEGADAMAPAMLDAQRRVQEEMVRLLRRDASLVPVRKLRGKKAARVVTLPPITDVARAAATALIEEESATLSRLRQANAATLFVPEDDGEVTNYK